MGVLGEGCGGGIGFVRHRSVGETADALDYLGQGLGLRADNIQAVFCQRVFQRRKASFDFGLYICLEALSVLRENVFFGIHGVIGLVGYADLVAGFSASPGVPLRAPAPVPYFTSG